MVYNIVFRKVKMFNEVFIISNVNFVCLFIKFFIYLVIIFIVYYEIIYY